MSAPDPVPAGAGAPSRGPYGPPEGDPLVARLFPPLPGRVLWGLDRIQRIMAEVGSPHRSAPALVVAGTNGKGSVAHLWAGVLQASGLRTGLYTSPHLVSFRERIQVDGAPLPAPFLEEVAEALRSPIVKRQPSFFEATTALAFLAFARAEVEVMVLEVGLGGRLDAVNVADPILTAVTNVGLDHAELLGADEASIAREKAGIFRPGVPAFTAAEHPAVLRVLAEEAASLGIPLARVGQPPGESRLDGHPPGTTLRLETRTWGRLDLHTPLLGAHQRTNVALAVRALEALPPRLIPPRRAVVEGVAATRVPGRLQWIPAIKGQPAHLLDVAHNPEGMAALVQALDELQAPRPRVAVVGILADKPVEAMLRLLREAVDRVILTTPRTAPAGRRWDAEVVAAAMGDPAVVAFPSLEAALLEARVLAGSGGVVVVTGSFTTVGEALGAIVQGEEPSGR